MTRQRRRPRRPRPRKSVGFDYRRALAIVRPEVARKFAPLDDGPVGLFDEVDAADAKHGREVRR